MNKDKYIGEMPPGKTRDITNGVFRRCAPYEKKLNKDICEFTKDEALDMYKDFRVNDSIYLTTVNTCLKKYSEWCVKCEYIKKSENAYSNITLQDLNMCVCLDTYYSYALIKSYRDSLKLNPSDRVLIAAPFYGFRRANNFEDLMIVRSESIDTTNNIVYLADRSIVVPSWLIKDLTDSLNTYSYFVGGKEYKLEGDCVIKFRSTENLGSGNISDYVASKFSRTFNKEFQRGRLSYINIFNSGVIYHCEKIMLENGISDVAELRKTKEFKDDVLTRFGLTPASFSRMYRPALDLMYI